MMIRQTTGLLFYEFRIEGTVPNQHILQGINAAIAMGLSG